MPLEVSRMYYDWVIENKLKTLISNSKKRKILEKSLENEDRAAQEFAPFISDWLFEATAASDFADIFQVIDHLAEAKTFVRYLKNEYLPKHPVLRHCRKKVATR